jgi:exosortase/archaeosortase family protein
MQRFVLVYLSLLLLLFFVFYGNIGSVADIVNRIQTQLTLDGVSLFIDHTQINADMLIVSSQLKLQVTKECNGLLPFIFYLAGVIAYRSSVKQKLLWILGGYIILSVVNILRIVGVYRASCLNPQWFDIVHNIIGNLIITLTVGVLLMYYFRYVKSHFQS